MALAVGGGASGFHDEAGQGPSGARVAAARGAGLGAQAADEQQQQGREQATHAHLLRRLRARREAEMLRAMSLPRPVAAVVFDMDGVLFDTETQYEKAALAAAREVGIPMTSEFFRSTVGSPWPVVRQQLLDHYGPDLAVDELSEIAHRIFRELTDTQEILKPGVRELLDLLDELRLPRAVATSSARPTVERHLQRHALADRFHGIAAHGDHDRHKPHPDPFLKAAEILGVDPPALPRDRGSASRCPLGLVGWHDDGDGARTCCRRPTRSARSACRRRAGILHEVRRLLSGSASGFLVGE